MALFSSKTFAVTDTWFLEVFSLLGSFLSLVSMILLLACYNNRPVFYWHGVTLNAVVSVLATVSKAWLMLPLSESISQWKWILFSRRREPLINLDAIDSASRGPLGSVQLLWRTKGAYVFIWEIA